MEGEDISQVRIYSPKFIDSSMKETYSEDYPENPDLEWTGTDKALKFGYNGWGISAEITPFIPQDFPKWLIEIGSKEFKKYKNSVLVPSFEFLKREIVASQEPLEELAGYMEGSNHKNDWFGLSDALTIYKKLSGWILFDGFKLGEGRGTPSEAISKLENISRKLLNEDALKVRNLSGLTHSDEGENYFSQSTIHDCFNAAVMVYREAQRMRDLGL